jgi:regulatory protein YycI of two-component signal transduction system YycFG
VKAEGIFISTLLVVDTFLVSFYFGFNSRHVLVVDPSLPSVLKAHTEQIPNENGASKRGVPAGRAAEKPAAKPISAIGKSHHKTGESKAISEKTDKTKSSRKSKVDGRVSSPIDSR